MVNITYSNNSGSSIDYKNDKHKKYISRSSTQKLIKFLLIPVLLILLNNTVFGVTYFYNAYRWDLNERYFTISDGSYDAYDNCYYLYVWCPNTGSWIRFYSNHYTVNNSYSQYGYAKNYQIMCNNMVNVTRFFFVNKSSTERWARYIDCIQNIGNQPITLKIRWLGNLGSDSSTREWATFYLNGQMVGKGTDDWDNGGDPSLAHIFGYNFTWSRSTDNIYMTSQQFTLSPGQKVCFVLFPFQGPNRATVQNDVNTLLSDIQNQNITAKWFQFIEDYQEYIVNFPEISIPPANISMKIYSDKDRYLPDEPINVTVVLNISNVLTNYTITMQTYLYDIVLNRNLSQYNETINVSTNITLTFNYTFIAPPRTDYYYICAKAKNSNTIERCIRIEVTTPIELINEVRDLINDLKSDISYLRQDVTNISYYVVEIKNITSETLSLLENLNNTTITKLNEILDNISIIKSQINTLSSDLQNVNQTLYNKLLNIQSQLTIFETNVKNLISAVENNLTDEINETKQQILENLTIINNTLAETNNIVNIINDTLTNTWNKLNELYNLTLTINGTTTQILNKTISILQQLYIIQNIITDNFTLVNEKLDWIINKLKNITTKVKPHITINCTKNEYYIGQEVECNIYVTVLNKPVNIPVEVYIQKVSQTYSLDGSLKTTTVTIAQFDKIYIVNGKGKLSFRVTEPGKYKIIVRSVPGYYSEDYYYEDNYSETEITVETNPWIPIGSLEYTIILYILLFIGGIGIIGLGLKTLLYGISGKRLKIKSKYFKVKRK